MLPGGDRPPLTARSVVASVLLGTEPPVMPSRALVRAGALFGLADGAVRTAVSRMVAHDELRRRDDGRYELAGHLVDRQARQLASRRPALRRWGGHWEMWVVGAAARSAAERAELRTAASALHLGELRDGVWLRPDNLRRSQFGGSREVVVEQAHRFTTQPDHDTDLVGQLWDLRRWTSEALRLRREMATLHGRLNADDTDALPLGFILAATVLRHLNKDPLLPPELLPRDWQGARLRSDYESYDDSYSALLRRWLQQN